MLTEPWPAMLRTIWGDDQRYKDTYWSRFENMYFAGDGAKLDEDGDIWLLGRVDDVMNVSGHRLSTTEIESALVSHPKVAEAAVVGAKDEDTGQAVCAFVILRDSAGDGGEDIVEELRAHVAKEIGKIARPRQIMVVPELPKTRSGKIMRRLLRDVAEDREVGDVTTLADSTVMDLISDNLKDDARDDESGPRPRRAAGRSTAPVRSAAPVRVTGSVQPASRSPDHPPPIGSAATRASRRHHDQREHDPTRRARARDADPDVPSKDDPTLGKLVADASRDISAPDARRDRAGQVRAQGQHQGRRARPRSVRRGRASSALLAVIMLSVAIAYFVHMTGLDLAWCFLIVFVLYLLLAGLLAFVGVRKVKQVRAPERAIHQAQETKNILKRG